MERVALVTGAARGIGRAIAADLARDHRVAITWLTTPPRDLAEGALAIRADLFRTEIPARASSSR